MRLPPFFCCGRRGWMVKVADLRNGLKADLCSEVCNGWEAAIRGQRMFAWWQTDVTHTHLEAWRGEVRTQVGRSAVQTRCRHNSRRPTELSLQWHQDHRIWPREVHRAGAAQQTPPYNRRVSGRTLWLDSGVHRGAEGTILQRPCAADAFWVPQLSPEAHER